MREFPTAQTDLEIERDVYTVDRLNKVARQLVESRFAQVWVEGEVSNISAPSSGHLYFTLKDNMAQIRCAFFKNRRTMLEYSPRDGAQVLLRARLTIYEPRGDLQLVVQHIEPAGEGALREQFEKLKRKLEKEGLFDRERKKPLPKIPYRIGIITSPTGAAVRDIVTTCRRRFTGLPLILYPTLVQGDFACDGIVQSIQVAGQRAECAILILARGGGSLEDLWAFNEERIARAMADCDIPIVTGIGHEIDFTIADFVADQRAATPSAAAEMVVPEASVIHQEVHTRLTRLSVAMNRKLEQATQRNDLLAHRLIHPTRRYALARHNFQLLYGRLGSAFRNEISRKKLNFNNTALRLLQHTPQHQLNAAKWHLKTAHERLYNLAPRLVMTTRQRMQTVLGRLNAISPLATLERGYAMVTDKSGTVVTQAKQVRVGSRIDVRLAQGALDCRVEDKVE
ncbi:MAG: exodeoxyribonuclease VII large subunit [Arenicellales bacterium]|nr:exodeoxyribonuclease VII large subunit [Arenicellales bacterium]